MKKTPLVLAIGLAIIGLSACNKAPDSETQANASKTTELVASKGVNTKKTTQASAEIETFAHFSEQFIDALWDLSPTWALYSGKHVNDGHLEIPNEANRNATLAFVKAQQDKLDQFDKTALTAQELIDYELVRNLLGSMQWEVERFKSWQWDPSSYNVSGGFAQLINEEFAPLDERLMSVLARMEHVPAYYQAARENINKPTLEHTQLAILQNQGAFSVFSDELLAKAMASSLSDEDKALFKNRFDASVNAIKQHIDWLTELEQGLTPETARSFRIGETLYEEKFAFDIQSGMTAKQLYYKALDDKNAVQAEMAKITDKIWTKHMKTPKPVDSQLAIKALIDTLSAKHVSRDKFVEEVRAQIPALIKFVNDKNLLTLDPNKPLVVRETPEYMRGFAGASISAPGPYEQAANTYYNVTPLDGMSDESAESYLREYNHWILQVLNIHEAIPGHYTQLVYSNQSPSLIKSLFGNGAMIEGWAVYTERMMLEQGYGDFEPEMWLMYYKWNLRVIANTILDYSIQVKGMTQAEAIDFMTQEAFQQQAEAEGKWRRATLSQVQLTSYYAGFREIYDLREAMAQSQGEMFELKQFHEQFLSYGSAPVKYIKQLMQQ